MYLAVIKGVRYRGEGRYQAVVLLLGFGCVAPFYVLIAIGQ